MQKLMAKMKQLTAQPLASYSHEWKVLHQQMVPIAATRAGDQRTGGHDQDSGRRFPVQDKRHRD